MLVTIEKGRCLDDEDFEKESHVVVTSSCSFWTLTADISQFASESGSSTSDHKWTFRKMQSADMIKSKSRICDTQKDLVKESLDIPQRWRR